MSQNRPPLHPPAISIPKREPRFELKEVGCQLIRHTFFRGTSYATTLYVTKIPSNDEELHDLAKKIVNAKSDTGSCCSERGSCYDGSHIVYTSLNFNNDGLMLFDILHSAYRLFSGLYDNGFERAGKYVDKLEETFEQIRENKKRLKGFLNEHFKAHGCSHIDFGLPEIAGLISHKAYAMIGSNQVSFLRIRNKVQELMESTREIPEDKRLTMPWVETDPIVDVKIAIKEKLNDPDSQILDVTIEMVDATKELARIKKEIDSIETYYKCLRQFEAAKQRVGPYDITDELRRLDDNLQTAARDFNNVIKKRIPLKPVQSLHASTERSKSSSSNKVSNNSSDSTLNSYEGLARLFDEEQRPVSLSKNHAALHNGHRARRHPVCLGESRDPSNSMKLLMGVSSNSS